MPVAILVFHHRRWTSRSYHISYGTALLLSYLWNWMPSGEIPNIVAQFHNYSSTSKGPRLLCEHKNETFSPKTLDFKLSLGIWGYARMPFDKWNSNSIGFSQYCFFYLLTFCPFLVNDFQWPIETSWMSSRWPRNLHGNTRVWLRAILTIWGLDTVRKGHRHPLPRPLQEESDIHDDLVG